MMNIVQVGIGPLGKKIVEYIQEREGIEIAAAVDSAPELIGIPLGDVCQIDNLDIIIQPTLSQAVQNQDIDAAIITTLSSVTGSEAVLSEAAKAGLPVVSTCEELSFPWEANPDVASRLNQVFSDNDVACVGTGVNPGFLMDYLPSVLTSLCQQVDKVEVYRVQDASPRRIPFQKKIGAGLDDKGFKAKVKAGRLRHVGLPESFDKVVITGQPSFESLIPGGINGDIALRR